MSCDQHIEDVLDQNRPGAEVQNGTVASIEGVLTVLQPLHRELHQEIIFHHLIWEQKQLMYE
jgi:hypothetical protein